MSHAAARREGVSDDEEDVAMARGTTSAAGVVAAGAAAARALVAALAHRAGVGGVGTGAGGAGAGAGVPTGGGGGRRRESAALGLSSHVRALYDSFEGAIVGTTHPHAGPHRVNHAVTVLQPRTSEAAAKAFAFAAATHHSVLLRSGAHWAGDDSKVTEALDRDDRHKALVVDLGHVQDEELTEDERKGVSEADQARIVKVSAGCSVQDLAETLLGKHLFLPLGDNPYRSVVASVVTSIKNDNDAGTLVRSHGRKRLKDYVHSYVVSRTSLSNPAQHSVVVVRKGDLDPDRLGPGKDVIMQIAFMADASTRGGLQPWITATMLPYDDTFPAIVDGFRHHAAVARADDGLDVALRVYTDQYKFPTVMITVAGLQEATSSSAESRNDAVAKAEAVLATVVPWLAHFDLTIDDRARFDPVTHGHIDLKAERKAELEAARAASSAGTAAGDAGTAAGDESKAGDATAQPRDPRGDVWVHAHGAEAVLGMLTGHLVAGTRGGLEHHTPSRVFSAVVHPTEGPAAGQFTQYGDGVAAALHHTRPNVTASSSLRLLPDGDVEATVILFARTRTAGAAATAKEQAKQVVDALTRAPLSMQEVTSALPSADAGDEEPPAEAVTTGLERVAAMFATAPSAASPPPHDPATDLVAALRNHGVNGTVLTAGMNAYNTNREQYARFSYPEDTTTPLAIVYPMSEEEVAFVVAAVLAYNATHEQSLSITARSGGHQYSGTSSGGSDTVVVDLRGEWEWAGKAGVSAKHLLPAYVDAKYPFNKVVFNKTTDDTVDSVTVGPGASLDDVSGKLADNGLSFPHGECPQVCIGGHAQTGGFGHMARSYGLAQDWVRQFNIVTAELGDNGVVQPLIRTVTRPAKRTVGNSNDDLFYAVLGGGPGSFGIVTSYVFDVVRDADTGPNPRRAWALNAAWLYYEPVCLAMMHSLKRWTRGIYHSAATAAEWQQFASFDGEPWDASTDFEPEAGVDLFGTIATRDNRFAPRLILLEMLYSDDKRQRKGKKLPDACRGFQDTLQAMKAADGWFPFGWLGHRVPKWVDSVPAWLRGQKPILYEGDVRLSEFADMGVRRDTTSPDGREFSKPFDQYVKSVHAFLTPLTSKFAKEFTKLCSAALDSKNVKLVMQFCQGGAAAGPVEVTGLPFRNLTVTIVYDLFYQDDAGRNEALQLQARMDAALASSQPPGTVKRVFWGSFSHQSSKNDAWRDTNMADGTVQRQYYAADGEPGAKYSDMQAIKMKADPQDLFHTRFTVQRPDGGVAALDRVRAAHMHERFAVHRSPGGVAAPKRRRTAAAAATSEDHSTVRWLS